MYNILNDAIVKVLLCSWFLVIACAVVYLVVKNFVIDTMVCQFCKENIEVDEYMKHLPNCKMYERRA